MKAKPCVLTIAGSDSGAGAGIQSDIKTFLNHGVYGVSVITAITAQNKRGIQSSFELPAKIIKQQINSVLNDFKIKVIKTGMLSSDKVVNAVADSLKSFKGKLIIDPVLSSKNKFRMLNKKGIVLLKKSLMPRAFLITPNIPEAEILSGMKIKSLDDIEKSAMKLNLYGCKNILIKGGHLPASIKLQRGTDFLFDGKRFYLFQSRWIETKNTHGIGCTYSASISSNLSKGLSLNKSIISAKKYLEEKLSMTVKLGRGINPVEQ